MQRPQEGREGCFFFGWRLRFTWTSRENWGSNVLERCVFKGKDVGGWVFFDGVGWVVGMFFGILGT